MNVLVSFATAVWRFVCEVAQRFQQDRCPRVASALSFTTLLAIVPLTAVTLAVLSLFPVFSAWMTVIQDFIYGNFMPTAGEVVQKYLTQFAAKAGRLTTVGLAFLVVTAIMMMATIEEAFNDIWRVTNRRKRLYRFLSYWALLTLGPILIAVSLTLTSKFFTALPLSAATERTLLNVIADEVLPLALEIGAIVLLYTVTPSAAVRWRHALVGGAFAVLLLEIARRLFAASMKYFTSYQVIYGAVAVLPIFLLWVYISWVIVLLGAIVTANLGEWYRKRPAPRAE